jgi:serine-type D-Ala-D-Ala carboxypeptidase/endopeptidase
MPRLDLTRRAFEAQVAAHLARDPRIGFVLGVASPLLPGGGALLTAGALVTSDGARPAPLGGATPFELCSCTKTFTATLFARICQRVPGLDEARLGDFLRVAPALASVPLRAIAGFVSGMPADNVDVPGVVHDRVRYPAGGYSVAELFRNAAAFAATPAPPGTAYTYSNFSFALLAELLPLASGNEGLTFPELLRAELLEPLGMRDTGFLDERAELRLPRGFDSSGAAVRPGSGGFPAHHGSGGLVSTPDDLSTWLRFNMGLLPDCPFNAMLGRLHAQASPLRTPAGLAAATGWFLRDLPAPGTGEVLPIVLKGGGLEAYMTWIGFVQSPQPGAVPSRAGVFALSNTFCDIRDVGQSALLALVADLEPTPRSSA